MINKQPSVFSTGIVEIGYSKIRIAHNTPTDIDIANRSIWYKLAGTAKSTATRIDIPYVLESSMYLTSLSEGTEYDISMSLVDEFVSGNSELLDSQYLGTASVLSITELNNITTLKSPTITNIEVLNSDQLQIGSPASTVGISFVGTASRGVVEVSRDNWTTKSIVHSGPITTGTIVVSLEAGDYRVRVIPFYEFSDGTIDTGVVDTYPTLVSVSNTIINPAFITNLATTGVKVLDNVASYDLRLSWDWLLGSGGSKQNTLVQYMEFTGTASALATLNWDSAVSEVSLGTDHTFRNVPYRKPLAVRVQVQGWNGNVSSIVYKEVFISENPSDSVETGYTVPVTGVDLADNTQVYIDNRFIQGFDGSSNKTFEFDAATGNVTIGNAGTYNGEVVTTPFQFDAANRILSISGQVITDEIVAADYVMGWLGGKAPSFRTANKTGYADGTNGMWMGYTDTLDTDFKVDIGSATQYIRWDGSELIISANVKISDGSTIGQKQKIVTIYKKYPKNNPTLVVPVGGTYVEPITPTMSSEGWLSYSPVFDDTTESVYSSSRLFTSDAGIPQDANWSPVGLYTTGGGTGTPAPYIFITPSTHSFIKSSVGVVSPDTINFNVVSANLAGPISWTTTPNVTLTVTGSTATLSKTAMGANKSVTVSVTDGVVTDSTTINLLVDGATGTPADPVIYNYSNSEFGAYDATYTAGIDYWAKISVDGGNTFGTAYRVVGEDAPQLVFQYSPTENGSYTPGFAAGVDYWARSSTNGGTTYGTPYKLVGDNGEAADPTIILYSNVINGVYDAVFTSGVDEWAKTSVDGGATYTDPYKIVGDPGEPSISAILSNEAHIVPTDNFGNNGIYTGSGTTVKVFEGSNPLIYDGVGTSNGTFALSILANGISSGSVTDSGTFATIADHTGISSDTATVTITVTGKSSAGTAISITKVQSLTRSKEAADGVAGSRGAERYTVGYAGAWPASWDTADAAFMSVVVATTQGATAVNDVITIYRDSNPKEQFTRIFTGGSDSVPANWSGFSLEVHGSAFIADTVSGDAFIAGTKITSPIIEGGKLTIGNVGVGKSVVLDSDATKSPIRIGNGDLSMLSFVTIADGLGGFKDVLQLGGGLAPSTITSTSVFTKAVLDILAPPIEGATGGISSLPKTPVDASPKVVSVNIPQGNTNVVSLSLNIYDSYFGSNPTFNKPTYQVLIERRLNTGAYTSLYNQATTGTWTYVAVDGFGDGELNISVELEDTAGAAVNDTIDYRLTVTHVSGYVGTPSIRDFTVSQQTSGGGTAGAASTLNGQPGGYYLDWPNFTNTPTNLSGYGITDAIKTTDARLTDSRPASDVAAWAKQPSKPSYNYSELSGTLPSHSHDRILGVSYGADSNVEALDVGSGELKFSATNSTNAKFPVSNNANGILSVGTHSGNYGSQLGFSSNGSVYTRHVSAGSTAAAWQQLYASNNFGKAQIDALGINATQLSGYSHSQFGKLASSQTWAGTQTFNALVDNGTNIGKGSVSLDTLASGGWAKPIGYSRMIRDTSSGFPSGISSFGYWTTQARRDSGGGYSGLLFPYAGESIKFGYNSVSGGNPIWKTLPFTENSNTWSGAQTFGATTNFNGQCYFYASGRTAQIGARNADWFHFETASNQGFYFYNHLNVYSLTSRGDVIAPDFKGKLNGYQTSESVASNSVVVRDTNGYTYLGWVNTPSGVTSSSIDNFYVSAQGDNFIRKKSKGNVVNELSANFLRSDTTSQMSYHLETDYGTHGGYGNSNGASSNWGVNIWSMGTAYAGSHAGTGYNIGNYCLSWIRSANTTYNSKAGEGVYIASQNSVRGGWGHLGFWTSGNIRADGNILGTDAGGTSDMRLKHKDRTIKNASDKRMALEGIIFEWNDVDPNMPEGEFASLRAQQVQKVFKHGVIESENEHLDTPQLNLSYSGMIGLLVESANEDRRELNNLKAEVAELKALVARLVK